MWLEVELFGDPHDFGLAGERLRTHDLGKKLRSTKGDLLGVSALGRPAF